MRVRRHEHNNDTRGCGGVQLEGTTPVTVLCHVDVNRVQVKKYASHQRYYVCMPEFAACLWVCDESADKHTCKLAKSRGSGVENTGLVLLC